MLLAAAAACTTVALPPAARADSNPFMIPDRKGLQAKWLESLRILLQDEADNMQYGGELAPGGPPPAVPTLTLIPIVQMHETLKKLAPQLATFDAGSWQAMAVVLSTGPFTNLEFKRIFNAYSDNIYYASDSPEANAYLLGGATPSTSQTTQYLLRNEALKQIGELRDELTYQAGLLPDKRETDVAIEAMQSALKAFDDYLKLAPADQYAKAKSAVTGV